MARTKLLAANWKMYKTPDQTHAFFGDFLPLVSGHTLDEIVICPPYVDLAAAIEAVQGSNVAVGAQNVHWKDEGDVDVGALDCPTSPSALRMFTGRMKARSRVRFPRLCCSRWESLTSSSGTRSGGSTSAKRMIRSICA